MVDQWFANTHGNSYRGFVSADEMWAALDPAAAPYYGMPIDDVPIRAIYNASPAALNVGQIGGWVGDLIAGLGNVAAHGLLLLAILGVLLLGLVYLFRGSR